MSSGNCRCTYNVVCWCCSLQCYWNFKRWQRSRRPHLHQRAAACLRVISTVVDTLVHLCPPFFTRLFNNPIFCTVLLLPALLQIGMGLCCSFVCTSVSSMATAGEWGGLIKLALLYVLIEILEQFDFPWCFNTWSVFMCINSLCTRVRITFDLAITLFGECELFLLMNGDQSAVLNSFCICVCACALVTFVVVLFVSVDHVDVLFCCSTKYLILFSDRCSAVWQYYL